MHDVNLQELIGENLRYIVPGRVVIRPFYNLMELHPIGVAKGEARSVDIFLLFGEQLNKILKLGCECVEYDQTVDYRFSFELLGEPVSIPDGPASIEVEQIIKEIRIYGSGVFENNELIINGLAIAFQHDRSVSLLATEGDTQHVPCIFLAFKTSNDPDNLFANHLSGRRLLATMSANKLHQ